MIMDRTHKVKQSVGEYFFIEWKMHPIFRKAPLAAGPTECPGTGGHITPHPRSPSILTPGEKKNRKAISNYFMLISMSHQYIKQ